MERRTERILTTHAGSLPRPADLITLLRRQDQDRLVPDESRRFAERGRRAVGAVVGRQVATGLDLVNDGEQGKAGYAIYVKDRLTGFGGTGGDRS